MDSFVTRDPVRLAQSNDVRLFSPPQNALSRTIPEGTRGPDFFTSLRLTGMVDLSRRDSNPSKRLQSVLHPKQLSGVRSLQLSHLRERLDRIIVELSAHKSALAGSIPHCIFCGATLVLNANFCHHCGGSSPSRSRGNNTGFCEAEASPRYDAVRVQYGGWSGRKTNFSSGGERVPQSDQRSIKVGFFTLRHAPSTVEGCFCCVLSPLACCAHRRVQLSGINHLIQLVSVRRTDGRHQFPIPQCSLGHRRR